MDIKIHATFLPHADPDESVAFYRDALGFEVRNDVGREGMRWITVGPEGQPETQVVLEPPVAPGSGVTEEEEAVIREMMAKGTYASLVLSAEDLDGAFQRLAEHDADIVEEPTDQPWGVRDGAVRDPAGNLIRIQQRG